MSAVSPCADGLVLRLYIQQVIIEKDELGRHKQVKILNPQSIPTEVAALTKQD